MNLQIPMSYKFLLNIIRYSCIIQVTDTSTNRKRGTIMASRILNQYIYGDMELTYLISDHGRVGMIILPVSVADRAEYLSGDIESLVQLYIRGDHLPGGFSNGLTLSETGSTHSMTYLDQTVTQDNGETVVTTLLGNHRGHRLVHQLICRDHARAFEVKVRFENHGSEAVVLENLSSFSFGRLSPFGDSAATNHMVLHRAKSWWSAEGRIESATLSQLHLEPSWSLGGVRLEKFGQTGSMPVRHYFPFVAAEDPAARVTWAAQLACPSSWQMEVRRQREYLSITGGLADYEYGHWCKRIEPGMAFDVPSAYLTVGLGGLDQVSQRLLDLHQLLPTKEDGTLPVIFNEFCTTWGNPCDENLRKIAATLKGRGIDYLVIDAGWFGDGKWWDDIGDWLPSANKFPLGLENAVKAIIDAGMKPGIWFELENCTGISDVARTHRDWLLTRHGSVITTGKHYLNFAKPEVKQYLQERVINFLNRYGFRYIKIDYNDSIGMGCDDPDGLGEGLRQHLLNVQDFFRDVHAQVPGIALEVCSSGGHRLEPSMLDLCTFASFSDAHECVHIPIIAADLHRLMQPSKSQIWAVLRKEDSLRRINYSLVNTMLGVMCLSGDIYDLSQAQWDVVTRGIDFYKKVSPIIRRGESTFYGSGVESYADPEGWQAVVRADKATGRTLVVIHTFGGNFPKKIRLPVQSNRIADTLCSEDNTVTLADGILEIELKANFEAIALALES